MKIYCMSDIHGCLAAFEEALNLFEEHLEEKDTRRCFWEIISMAVKITMVFWTRSWLCSRNMAMTKLLR